MTSPRRQKRWKSRTIRKSEEKLPKFSLIKLGLESSLFSSLNIDYALYKKFWMLQDFFRKPQQCYERLHWKTFITVCSFFGLQ